MTRGVKIGAFVIGGVALVVAGIGIMNIMLVSVTERTQRDRHPQVAGRTPTQHPDAVPPRGGGALQHRRGHRRGARLRLRQRAGEGFHVADFEAAVPVGWAVIGLVFCSAVGVAFGMMPAVKASRLNPIEALRYE